MKYTISFILILCFVFTLFTACGQTPETPTDVNSPETQQTAGGEGSSVDLQQEVQEKTQEEHQSQNEQSAPVQTASKEIGMKESAVSNNKENNDNQLQGDEPWSPPAGFTSVEGFRSWLQTGGIEEEKERNY